MTALRAGGLPADWLNGWLAALGVTVLIEGVRLRWSREPQPVAEFEWDRHGDLGSAVDSALQEAGGRTYAGAHLRRQASLDEYRSAAARARTDGDFSLAMVMTDLALDREGKQPGPTPSTFYTSGPGTVGTIGDRLDTCLRLIPPPGAGSAAASLAGHGPRVKANGLGFDVRRIAIGDMAGDFGEMYIDPVIEALAFFGLAFFTVRGDGNRAATRGWSRRRARMDSFTWFAWGPAIDRWSIDAALSLAFAVPDVTDWRSLASLEIHAVFESVAYTSKGSADPTRAFASRRVR